MRVENELSIVTVYFLSCNALKLQVLYAENVFK